MTRTPLGETRTRVCRDHAMIGTDSYVNAPLFGWTDTPGVILISPAMASATGNGATRGPGFAMYLAMMTEQSSTTRSPAGTQRCAVVLEGRVTLDGKTLDKESFAYLPADSTYQLTCSAAAKLLVFEKRYVSIDGVDPPALRSGKIADAEAKPFLGDEDAMLAALLPDAPEFDMAVNVFTYQSGAALPFVETHIMEHGLYMSAGQGVYRLAESWYPVATGDSIWMAAYCPQWFVAMGKTPAQYIYYKDVNRNHLP